MFRSNKNKYPGNPGHSPSINVRITAMKKGKEDETRQVEGWKLSLCAGEEKQGLNECSVWERSKNQLWMNETEVYPQLLSKMFCQFRTAVNFRTKEPISDISTRRKLYSTTFTNVFLNLSQDFSMHACLSRMIILETHWIFEFIYVILVYCTFIYYSSMRHQWNQ